MYSVIRLMLRTSVLLAAYCIAVIGCMYPSLLMIVGLLTLVALARRPRKPTSSYGSARWGTEDDLRKAGMIGG